MKLETPITTLKKSPQEVYEYLLDLNNFEKIMPSNKEKFEVEGDSFLVGIYGVPDIRMIISEKAPYSKIVLSAASSKIDFTLTINIAEEQNNLATSQLLFEGNFNPMVAMMVKKPLTNFINDLSNNLQTI